MVRFFKILVVMVLFFIRVGSADNERKDMPDVLDVKKLREQLVRHEGLRQSAYQDSLGYLTIGVGHLIDERKGGKISLDSCYAILDEDIRVVCSQLDEHLSWWKNLDPVRQQVLANMAFNLGIEGLLAFHNTLAFIEHGQYSEASVAMLDSKWAVQTGKRARELAQMMKDGV